MPADKTINLYKSIVDLEAADNFDKAEGILDTLISTRATSIEGIAAKVRYLAKLAAPGDDLVSRLIASLDTDLATHVPV